MKRRLAVTLAGLAISFALPIFGQQNATIDPRVFEQLGALGQKYHKAYANNDPAALAALYNVGRDYRDAARVGLRSGRNTELVCRPVRASAPQKPDRQG